MPAQRAGRGLVQSSCGLQAGTILYRFPIMPDDLRLSIHSLKVLATLLKRSGEPVAGSEFSASNGTVAGTLYPILSRFEKSGWLTSEWEAGDPHKIGRPRRRFYRLTDQGRVAAEAALRDLQVTIS